MRSLAISALCGAALCACGEEPAAPPASALASALTEHVRLRDDARIVLERWCGQCHISAYDSALPRALAVFDLSEPEWSARMSTTQLEDARGRVRDRRGPEGDLPITDDEIAIVERYVAHEIERRAVSD